MSFPAARLGDTTVHGGVVTLGTPLVLIGSRPASRIGDLHTCPLLSPNPHVGGPLILGAFNVLTAGPPQSRVLDSCICAAPAPDMVAVGEFTVLVGMAGAFAGGLGGFIGLVLGGLAAGLGNLVHGYPRAVACPVDAENPEGYYTEYAPGVVVRGSAEFQQRSIAALDELAATPSGQQILSNIAASGKTVTIVETSDDNGFCTAANGNDARNGTGTDSTVQWNPNHNTTDPADPVAGSPGSTVILGHEMIHAMHNATGTNANGPYDSYPGQSGSSARGEERATVGEGGTSVTAPDGSAQAVPDYSHDSPTENSLRNDLGIPPRPTYYPSTWPGGPPW